MKISQIIKNNKTTVSLEVFPPKQWDKIESTKKTVLKMLEIKPNFMSVTYGAAGTTSGFTSEISKEILANDVTPLSHLTCLTSTKEKIHTVADELKTLGIENVLALRGDIPEDFIMNEKSYFSHASELITELKSLGNFCIGSACYPECHPESTSVESDLKYLKLKQTCGADFFTTQMFFDNDVFYKFKDECEKISINIPIIAGIMPITNINQIGRTISLSGCTIPKGFSEIASKYGSDNAAMGKAGIDYAIKQIRELLENGQKNIHIYTMNKPETTWLIYEGIKDLI